MRGRPRMWDHDYLHLRPLAEDLRVRLATWGRPGGPSRILDLGSGGAPYRDLVGASSGGYVRCDADRTFRPEVAGRAERLPFAEGVFDAVLCTQVLELVSDPGETVREIGRVLASGGIVCLTTPGAYPYDSPVPGHRFGERQLRELFSGLTVIEILPQGGMMAAPFLLANVAAREVVLAARRRIGGAAVVLRPVAGAIHLVSNACGRLLEILASHGPLAPFLGALNRRFPMNFLVLAVKP